jgi:hypothetical protein
VDKSLQTLSLQQCQEFDRSTIQNAESNPDEGFAELFYIRRRLEEDTQCKNFGDASDYLQKITCCLLKLTVIKDQLIK